VLAARLSFEGQDADDCGSGAAGVEGMNQGAHLSAVQILIGAISVANICLLVTAIFYGGHRRTEGVDARERMSFLAVFLGLSSQVFYLLMMGPLTLGWLFLDRDSILHQMHLRFPTVGLLLSAVAFFTGWFGRGMRRYMTLWVAVSSGFFWLLANFAFMFTPL
jgi:hypothetical protein